MNLTLESLIVVGTFLFIFIAFDTNIDADTFGLALTLLVEISGYGAWTVRMTLQLDIAM